ncbi:hypothetical protein EDF81_0623 [Enterobacter sp. BIGb0383]|uniref:hypothetical protein n=1 Tax=unclassified Enterobacter TaxID=2608935 RepID=UPI000F47BD44|nr:MULTISPECIES: hypothetical protein [unclassified Enterobacter]ROP62140.1 hypothetical protein EDF81_0623 [Enterobacter sp. BIGb0383]ROS12301.1 hypothetical protein EC848_0625 [Enterobacter sp. BIGb0359]
MKRWLPGLALLAVSVGAQAENYRIVQSPSQKLDVWIDNIKDNTTQSWCGQSLQLRIVANGEKNLSLLDSFMPRLGALLESQCAALQQVNWLFTAPDNQILGQGAASKKKEWASEIHSDLTLTLNSDPASDGQSQPADRTPWQEFTLQDGCHLRTFWQGDVGASALFIPAKADGKCEKGGWLNGRSEVTQEGNGGTKQITMTFVHGFPVSGLSETVDADRLLITSVNNERMVVSAENADQSWLILPYVSALNGWKADGTVAVELPRDMASDDVRLRARLDAVRARWTPWLEPGTKLNILLVDALHPQLRNPAAGTYRTVN